MSPRWIPVFALLFSCQYVYCFTDDPVVYLPPFEVRPVKSNRVPGFVPNQQFSPYQHYTTKQQFAPNQQLAANQQYVPNQQSFGDQQSQPNKKPSRSQQILHTNTNTPDSKPHVEKEKQMSGDGKNFTFNDILEALNTIEDKKESSEASRASDYDHEQYPPYGYGEPSYDSGEPSYGYGGPSYGYHQPRPYSHYHEPSTAYHPPAVHPGSKVAFKSGIGDIVKPVATKVAGKVSGLIGLVLALLTGSAPNDLELKGFADIVINGIVKPLLIAKGGIKSLISKLTIPVISLLLINLEVLVTIWWLWEDCQEVPAPPPYIYPRPHSY